MKHFKKNVNAGMTACGLEEQEDFTFVARETKCMNCRKVLKAELRQRRRERQLPTT